MRCLWKLFKGCDWKNWNDRLLILSSFYRLLWNRRKIRSTFLP